MAKVRFQTEIEVPNSLTEDVESDEELVDIAREIMAVAPAFDGISDEFISELEGHVTVNGENPRQNVYCPSCGELMFEDIGQPPFDLGQNCPNYCGWVDVEMDGEDLAVKLCPTTY